MAIAVQGLRKSYGTLEAVRGIDFEVGEGEVFGLLGPNGAGKTSTLEILEGLRPRDGGQVSVLSLDPSRESRALKERIGVCLQATNVHPELRVSEVLDFYSALYRKPVPASALLRRLLLWEKRRTKYSELSGGQKQRLALALALVNDPQILFLDEPSAGLDAHTRHEIYDVALEMRAAGKTIVVTTHYIEEAERLCDRLAIMHDGRIIALGTPAEIRARSVQPSTIEIRCDAPLPGLPPEWPALTLGKDSRGFSARSPKPAQDLVEMVTWLTGRAIGIVDVQLRRPTLEEVFMELTGRGLRA
jgi:ABC-2 type transport system ATP-binding protein